MRHVNDFVLGMTKIGREKNSTREF